MRRHFLDKKWASYVMFAQDLACVWAKASVNLSKIFADLGKLWPVFKANLHSPNWFGQFCTCPNLKGNTDCGSMARLTSDIHSIRLSNFIAVLFCFFSKLIYVSVDSLYVVGTTIVIIQLVCALNRKKAF